MSVSERTVQSQPLKDIYKDLLHDVEQGLSETVKDKYSKFLREFYAFYQSDLHNGFLHNRKADWKTPERTCSVCHAEASESANGDAQAIFNLPFLVVNNADFGISSCRSKSDCWKRIQEYIENVRCNVGPFQPEELLKTESFVNSFGDRRTNYHIFRIPNNPLRWIFGAIHLQMDEKKEDIIAVVELANHHIGTHGHTQITLKELIVANPVINFRKVIDELPDTVGGRFVKQYIQNVLNSTS